MPKTETGMLIVMEANSGRREDRVRIECQNNDAREHAFAEWLAQKMTELNHLEKFSFNELYEAPWMPPQTEVVHKTRYRSLSHLADDAYRIVHEDPSGLTPQGKKLTKALRRQSV